ncbi:histidine kinase [Paenibacillus filicis]|uniref:Histidine kinase n=1 Tax=Paenibacillus gyeongsangnamensis TaxID=3388067 RepID=A0ABT4QAB1_9BACL|nr:histidine kinase [Paenibacillus filicis]MCZ8513711.1 histidine kinase [Paenibacillus filicis]
MAISKQTIEEQASASNLKTLSLISEKLNIMASDVSAISNIYFSNDDLRVMLMGNWGTGAYEESAKKRFLTKIIINYKYAYTWLEYYTSIFGLNGFELHTFYDGSRIGIDSLTKESWYEEAVRQNGGIVWVSDPSTKLIPTVDEGHFVSAIRVLKDFESGKLLGLLMINVNESFLYKQYAYTVQDYDRLFLVDGKGTIISAPDKSLIHQNIGNTEYYKQILRNDKGNFISKIDNNRMLVTYHTVDKTGWTIIAFTSLDKLLNNIYKVQFLNLVVFVIVLLLSVIVSYFIAIRLSVPVKRLYNSMKKVEMGDLSERSDVKGEDEIGELAQKFNRMVARIEELRDRVLLEQEMKRRSELQSLQSQINTHFLYNTLASIRYMLLTESVEKVDSIIIALVKLLKKTLTDESEYIPIGEEIENLKNYVYIQTVRQNGKLHVAFDIDDRILHYKTLKLLFQPIVENAIFHGVEPKEGSGSVIVKGWMEEGEIWFRITDDGIGIEGDDGSEEGEITSSVLGFVNGLGLRNVVHRISLHFGDPYCVKIYRPKLGGTTVLLRLPVFMKAEELKRNEHLSR